MSEQPRLPQRPLRWDPIITTLADLLPPRVYIVGGAVRDAYLHRPLKDLDLAVEQDGIALARLIANRLHGDFYPIDPKRGTGRAIVQTEISNTLGIPELRRLIIDVATFRGATLSEDLRARDFTINAMAVDLHEPDLLIDPLNGEADLKQKVLRQCSPASLVSDPLRALRAVRQSAQFGLRIEPGTMQAIRQASLVGVSPERVRDELIAIAAVPQPGAALRVMRVLGLIDPLRDHLHLPLHAGSDPEWDTLLRRIDRLSEVLTAVSYRRTDQTAASFDLGMLVIQLDRYRQRLNTHVDRVWPNERPHRALLVLALLVNTVDVDHLVDRLRLSSEEARLLKVQRDLPPLIHQLQQGWDALELYRFWSIKPHENGIDLCLLAIAVYLGEVGVDIDQDVWLRMVEHTRVALEAYFDRYAQLVEPPMLVNGQDLVEFLQIHPGPRVGKLLEHIRRAQVTGAVTTREEALATARAALDQL